MHGIPILGELMVVLAVSLVVVYAFQLVRLPTIVGFLLSGMLVGPGGLGLAHKKESIEILAEIGVALLLFTVGLEFSLRDLLRMRLMVFGGGAGQLLLTIAAAALLLAVPAALAPGPAVFMGALLALSSTAIVLRILGERAESGTLHGRSMLAILIFQDLAVVPLILLVPMLSGELRGWQAVAWPLGKAVLVVVGMLLVATWAVPWLLRRIVRVRSRELFTLATLAIALGAAYLTSLAELSLALGAFMAGMVVSESEYAHQMLSEIAPMRDAFNTLFFVSIGMLMTPAVVVQEPLLVVGLVLGSILLKAGVAALVALACGLGLRVALLVGLGLAQVGEFSFVLAQEGLRHQLLGEREHKLFLVVSVLTMVLTPALIPLGHWLAERLVKLAARQGGPRLPGFALPAEGHGPKLPLRDHVVVVGYGINGRNVTRVLTELSVPFAVIELNVQTVERERQRGVPIVYGDATRRLVLEHVHVEQARAVVVSAGDAAACRQVVSVVRALAPQAALLVRAHLMAEVEPLYALGATEVVAEELETSLELAGLVMTTYGVTSHAVERTKLLLREEQLKSTTEQPPRVRRGTQRFQRIPRPRPLAQLLAAVDVEGVEVVADSWVAGKTLKDLRLRAETGASILVVLRERETIPNPPADLLLRSGDQLVLCGRPEQIEAVRRYLEGTGESARLPIVAPEAPIVLPPAPPAGA